MTIIYKILIILTLGFVGAAMGSFAGAMVWRFRAQQLKEEADENRPVDKKELKRLQPLLNKKGFSDRSIDLDTGKQLPWYDMIPVFSWLALGGKSRFSQKPIGRFELFIELAMAVFFIISFIYWPGGLTNYISYLEFIIWLAAGVVMGILFSYDLKWYLLPNSYTYLFIFLGVINFILHLFTAPDMGVLLQNTFFSLLILSGLYYILLVVSSEKWVGAGDSLLGIGLALFLLDWKLSFLALFLANAIGVILVLPKLIKKTLTRKDSIPLGPLLIIGMVISFFWGQYIIDEYFRLML